MDANDIKATDNIKIIRFQKHLEIGDFHYQKKDIDSALKNYFSALKIDKTSNILLQNTFYLFCTTKISNLNKKTMKEICLFFLNEQNIRHQLCFRNSLKLTTFHKNKDYNEKKLDKCNKLNDKLISILEDKVLQQILRKCLLVDFDLEIFLTQIRKNLLENYLSKKKNSIKKIYKFLICFAEQCFLSDYIFKSSKKEEKLLSRIEQSLYKKRIINEYDVLLISLYKPIGSLKYLNNQLSSYNSKSKDFNNFLKFTFRNPKYEHLLGNKIKEISKIENKKSVLIKNQYEANPYPRWRNINLPEKIDISDFIFQNTNNNINLGLEKKKILIAGCGTGQQIFGYSGINDVDIFAIDISKTSLAFAKRMTDKHKIHNIKYFQMDLLNIDLLKESFDIIICSGCLHHMEKPFEGLQSLYKVLKPDGFMKLGLYSTIARSSIIDLRNYIKRSDLKFNKQNIFRIREMIVNSNNDEIKKLSQTPDFYSTSSFRDLIFNRVEHTFDLIEIKNEILKQNLRFLGFDLYSNHLQKFKACYPDHNSELDLENWYKFEIKFPKTFVSMYNFWVSKI